MKTPKKLATVLALILVLTIPVLAFAEDAAASVPAPEKTYTIEEMLTLALQNEYESQALYTAISDALKTEARVGRQQKAGSSHAAILTALMEAYGYAVPENKAENQAKSPASLEEAFAAAATMKAKSIDLYESFLAQENLPDSLRTVFEALKASSANRFNGCLRFSQQNGMGRGGKMNRWMMGRGRQNRMQENTGTCPVCGGSCTALPGN